MCSTLMLCAGYQSVPVNVQHQYVIRNLSVCSGKCSPPMCLAAQCLLKSVQSKTVCTPDPFHFVALLCLYCFMFTLKETEEIINVVFVFFTTAAVIHGLLIHHICRSHTTTHHSQFKSPGLMKSSSNNLYLTVCLIV